MSVAVNASKPKNTRSTRINNLSDLEISWLSVITYYACNPVSACDGPMNYIFLTMYGWSSDASLWLLRGIFMIGFPRFFQYKMFANRVETRVTSGWRLDQPKGSQRWSGNCRGWWPSSQSANSIQHQWESIWEHHQVSLPKFDGYAFGQFFHLLILIKIASKWWS